MAGDPRIQVVAIDRKRAIAAGQALYRDYGDDVAKPRYWRPAQYRARQDAVSRASPGGDVIVHPLTDESVPSPLRRR